MALRRNERALRRRFLFVVRHVALPSCCLLAIVGIVTYAPYQEPGPTELREKRDNAGPRLPVPPPSRLFEELKRLKRNNNVRKLLIKDDDVTTTMNSIVTSYVETNVNPSNVSEAPVLVMSGSVRSRNYARTVLSSTGNLTWEKRLPGALIIGVKKGGTRALLEFLRLHPDIRAPGPEIHYFDKYYAKGVNWYRSQMPPSLSDQLTIEKTPSYFVTPEVAGRVRELCPSVKLIVVVRDPVTRAISDYTQAASKHSDLRSFEDMAFLNSSTGLLDTSWTSLKIGIYAKHLERWLNHFNLSQIHFVSGEGLIMDPVSELTKVQSFLGLDTIISDKHFYFNETKGFPCLKKSEGNGSPHCLGKTKGRIHAKIHPETIQRLNDFYRPFNLKFYQMVGQDFGWP